MPLIPCPDCGREVSDRAPSCPNCGAPIAGASIRDRQVHGRGEGIFMKSLNCGCLVVLLCVALIVAAVAVVSKGAETADPRNIESTR